MDSNSKILLQSIMISREQFVSQ